MLVTDCEHWAAVAEDSVRYCIALLRVEKSCISSWCKQEGLHHPRDGGSEEDVFVI